MSLRSDIERALGGGNLQRFLDEALDGIGHCDAPAELLEVARWAFAAARDGAYAPLMMVAAAARSKALAPGAELEESTLVAAISDLDQRLRAGDELERVFDAFGAVGAALLQGEVSRFFDMKVDVEDPALQAWISGVMALRNR